MCKAGPDQAISCHYADGNLCHYIDIKGTTQEELADEIIEMVRKRLGKDVDVDYAVRQPFEICSMCFARTCGNYAAKS